MTGAGVGKGEAIGRRLARRAIEGGKFPAPVEPILNSYPIPHLGRPEEVAAACAFFAPEDASYITAQLPGVTGGADIR